MPLVVTLIWMWISVHAFAALPRKLPPRVNVLLYMALSVIDINKFTLFGFTYKLYVYNTKVPEFLSAVVHRDFTFSIAMLTFANVCLTTNRRAVKAIAAAGSSCSSSGRESRCVG